MIKTILINLAFFILALILFVFAAFALGYSAAANTNANKILMLYLLLFATHTLAFIAYCFFSNESFSSEKYYEIFSIIILYAIGFLLINPYDFS
jgi:magnesium-transporting ATPase (P-type)